MFCKWRPLSQRDYKIVCADLTKQFTQADVADIDSSTMCHLHPLGFPKQNSVADREISRRLRGSWLLSRVKSYSANVHLLGFSRSGARSTYARVNVKFTCVEVDLDMYKRGGYITITEGEKGREEITG